MVVHQHQDDIWLALQSNLISACHNWRQTRLYSPSLSKRTEGWTEKWGSSSETTSPSSECWKMEEESVQHICATVHPNQTPITLFQYRPAWTEQLALRVANAPYTVVNHQYAVTEMTGPLPYLRELQPNLPPVLTGRGQADGSTGNAILQYLQKERGIDLDEPLHNGSKDLEAMSKLYTNLIQSKLQNALCALRYQDWEAWDQVYRPQCVQAAAATSGSNNSSSGWSWLQFPGWWQAWSERAHMRSMLSHDTRSLTTEQAVQQVREVYAVLEEEMAKHNPPPTPTSDGADADKVRLHLLGTVKPVMVDLMLWDHLMQALMDVHLVMVLADFPMLCRYIQQIWDKYFAATDTDTEWKEWNVQENARNAFAQLPLLEAQAQKEKEPHTFRQAVDLMEQLSVRTHDLHESVTLAKEVRVRQEQMRSARKVPPFYTWYRWRMGDELFPTPVAQSAQREATGDRQDDEMKKEFRRNDEVWMTGVGVVTALTAVMFLVSSSQGE
jgi:hypothetical protein